jgi:DNA-binding CsgD family transcriptional regulator
MYKFIYENFVNSSHFLETALKALSLTWSIKSKRVLSVSSNKEIPFREEVNYTKSNLDGYTIYDFIPVTFYKMFWRKASRFFVTCKGKKKKDFILTFALNKIPGIDLGIHSTIATIHIYGKLGTASLCITNIDAAVRLNDNLLLIFEHNENGKHNVVYTISINSEQGVCLINSEYDILNLLAKGYESETIADLLHLSKHTVDGYRKTLLKKFKAKNTLQLIYHAFKEGYI